MKTSRRRFAQGLACTGLASTPILAAPQQPAPPANTEERRGTIPDVPPFQAPIEFSRSDVKAKVHPFPMTLVRLLPGPFADAAQWNRSYMSRLPVDRLVRNFRVNAGLPSSAEPFGGWEQPNNGQALHRQSELRGHFTGHFLSASALSYASTGDNAAKTKGDEIVDELAKCQKKLNGGYLSAFSIEFFDRLDARQNVWAPFYTVHKIMAGMLDMYELAGNKQALEVLQGMAGWADQWTASKSEEHLQDILNTEYGGMNETLYNLTAITKDDRWAKVGDRYTKKKFFNPLASRRDELRGLHVNTHIPQVIGAARRYELSGDYRFHDVADYFWYEVVGARSYVTTGTSNGEGWLAQPRQLASELPRSVATQECCCSYNMLKLTRHLYEWTADPRYFDYYERSLLNMRLGTIHPQTGQTQYYLSLTPGTWKTFNSDFNSFWCCTGTGIEEYSKLNDSIYWHDAGGVYINLFISSELNWIDQGLRLRQETRFPESPATAITISAEKPVRTAIRIRVPEWAGSGASVKINGKPIDGMASAGSYVSLEREWKTGDRIEMTMPMRLSVETMPDNPKMQAFLYGPLVLAGDLGSDGLTQELLVGSNVPQIRKAPALDIPSFHGDPLAFIKPADGPLGFRTTGQKRDVSLAPVNSIFGKRYSVYWQVS
ncbi:MAG TPA: glycoside hydrolase family 127 protein [Bryobacteraceae bacterium]|nr:glycoside hydrolase family 127 protein [Bryobacteraceae bacterium]